MTVRHDGVVIRGRGADKTKIDLSLCPAVRRCRLLRAEVRRSHRQEHADHAARSAHGLGHDDHPGGRPRGPRVEAQHAFGQHVRHQRQRPRDRRPTAGWSAALRGVARYQDGTSLTTEIPVVLDSKFNDTRQVPDWRAAILFAGRGLDGPPIELTRDGRRGDRTLALRSTAGLKPGDCIFLEAPATPEWKQPDEERLPVGHAIASTNCKSRRSTATRSPPASRLRIDFPVVDGAFVRKVVPIQRCGVEDLSPGADREPVDQQRAVQSRLELLGTGRDGQEVRPLPGLRQSSQVVRDPRLRVRRRLVQRRRRHGLRRLGQLLGLPDGERRDVQAAARSAVPVGGQRQRDPQERLPRQRRPVARRLDATRT